MLVLTGLDNKPPLRCRRAGAAATAALGGAFLTGVHAEADRGADIQAGISVDQIAAPGARQRDAARVARARRSSRPTSPGRATPVTAAPTRTRMCWRGADDAAADGKQSARGVRAAVRRQRQHRPGGAAGAHAQATQHARLGHREGSPTCSAARAERSRRSWTSISTRSATSSAAFRRPRSRARASCRWSSSRRAFRRRSRSTSG